MLPKIWTTAYSSEQFLGKQWSGNICGVICVWQNNRVPAQGIPMKGGNVWIFLCLHDVSDGRQIHSTTLSRKDNL